MTRTALGRDGAPYGAAELKDTLHLYWMAGLGIAIAIHLGAIGSFYLTGGKPDTGLQVVLIHVQPPRWLPPPLNPGEAPQVNVAERNVRNRSGIPVPVPPALVDTEVALTPNNVPISAPGPEGAGTGGSGDTVWAPPDENPGVFEAVEGLPKLVRSVPPVYPDLAVRSGLEGIVRVRILVDREGKPGAVSVVSSSADIFNDAAVAAAWKFLFTPGYSNSGPVPVSVDVPFRFRLADRK
ncbi:MAG TPA: TonB family protein [Bacteroidota bacterium]|nr:TonB family protein [Bacteroidota bacterium]